MDNYFIDYENVSRFGLDGISQVIATNRIMIFYRKEDATLRTLRSISSKYPDIEMEFFTHDNTALNYMDFQIDTCLGYCIARMKREDRFYIISRDRGFEAVKNFWKPYDIEIHLQETISGRPLPSTLIARGRQVIKDSQKKRYKLTPEFKKQVKEALAEFNLTSEKEKEICRFVAICNSEKTLKNAINNTFRDISSRKIYNKVLGIYRDWIKYLGSL